MRTYSILAVTGLTLALTMVAKPARAQWRADLAAVTFDRAPVSDTPALSLRLRTGTRLHTRMPPHTRKMVDAGDLGLMFLGGLLGGAAGYLVGDAAHSGIASVLDTRGISEPSNYQDYLAVLPAVGSAFGASLGAGTASCVKYRFGSFYQLDSCADSRWTLIGALPGAALGYAFRSEGIAASAGAILLEAAGAAIAGRLARDERHAKPTW